MSDWTDIITALSAPVAIGATIYAINAAAKKQRVIAREQTATAIYHEYLKSCIENPELSSWLMAEQTLELPNASKVWDEGGVASERYLWFVSYALSAFDEVLDSPGDYDWNSVIRDQIGYHKPIIAACWKHWEGHYSDRLGRLVGEVVGVTGHA